MRGTKDVTYKVTIDQNELLILLGALAKCSTSNIKEHTHKLGYFDEASSISTTKHDELYDDLKDLLSK